VSLPRIGVFDSGVGGLTVLKAISEQMPAHYLYFGIRRACPMEPSQLRRLRAIRLPQRFSCNRRTSICS